MGHSKAWVQILTSHFRFIVKVLLRMNREQLISPTKAFKKDMSPRTMWCLGDIIYWILCISVRKTILRIKYAKGIF